MQLSFCVLFTKLKYVEASAVASKYKNYFTYFSYP